MIAPSVPRSAICLRCQLRLIHQSSQPFQASRRIFRLQHPSLRRFASNSPAHALGQDQVAEGHERARDSEELVQDGKHASSQESRGVKRTDVRKRRFSRNRILTEDAQSLESDMLGKPASVIVMRDGGVYQKRDRRRAAESHHDEPDSEPIDIEALLDTQREPPDLEEVRDNIDGLRPKTETALSEWEFRKLQALLTDGFLSSQLEDYLQRHRQDAQPDDVSELYKHTVLTSNKSGKKKKKKVQVYKYDWISDITPWVPLASQSGVAEGIDPSLYGYVTASTTAKEKLAIQIMRECWGLSIAELDAGLGETRVKIRNYEFLLLMRGTRRWVTVMGKIWLEPGEKIEAFRAKNTLRLVTTKTKAAILIEDLNNTLRQITSSSFPLNLVASEPIDEAVLEEVGHITNTHVRCAQESQRVYVTWIELKKRAAKGLIGLEDMRDIVFRLLLTACNPQPATTTTLYAASEDGGALGRFITSTVDKERLGWKDRMGRWARYSLPLTIGGANSAAESPVKRLELPVERQIVSSEFDENNESLPETQFSLHPLEWAEDLQVSTKATFGYLLHATHPSASPPPLPDLLTANHPRVFASASPHPLHLAKLEASDDEAANVLIQPKTTIVIRFWPSPADSNQEMEPAKGRVTPLAPPLELRLATSGGEVKGVESLHAIKRAHITDVMLPASLVDLRYTQAQYSALQGERAKLATWQPLADFLQPARLDLARDKFEVPPSQKFPIPRRLFTDYELSVSRNVDWDSLMSITYTFVGLEIHRSVSMPYEGFNLTYTSVDAQRGGGRRVELSLEAGAESGTSAAEVDADRLHSTFLVASQKLARTDALWSGYLATSRES
ncbi:mitochondrial inner-membrane-bound regulator-domain-containing protein [Hypoxylon sp. FL0543]|nr:mitochondrial inner-membrane-bound regulator-domain-containing protein [Hypoxylon sp. FL0543]